MDWAAVATRRAPGCPFVRFQGHPPHDHDRAQVIYVALGGATVQLETITIELAETEGVWLPAGARHAVDLESQSVMLGPLVDLEPPDLNPQLVAHPDLQRTMTLLLSVSPTTVSEVRDLRAELEGVLLETVRPYFPLPLPTHPAARSVARRCVVSDLSLDQLAAGSFISARQLQRLFRDETGQSFSIWRTRARLNRAIAALRTGCEVREAQQVAGFGTRDGLERAIRRETGCTLAEFARAPHTLVRRRGPRPATTASVEVRPGDRRPA